ncbi:MULTISPECIES: hypothetical protein [Thermodesulfovibrio]|jgi:minor curlin subunit|uniref:hypothetical protein n=1 Tax=Thermodesulfovibrio TaxID=28261 RepID=UPI002639B235|nr:hypothetical protein [Thermodesulfovibrio sp.]
MEIKKTLVIFVFLIFTSISYAFDCGFNGYIGCSVAEIEQIGIKNNAYIEQSISNKASIHEDGVLNIAEIKQSPNSFLNMASIRQFGMGNFASQSQKGMANLLNSEQVGFMNSISQTQAGQNNLAMASQFGVGNKISQEQYTSHNSATATQIGFYNSLYQIQGLTGSMGNKNRQTQIGYGLFTIIVQ